MATVKQTYKVEGMMCAMCASHVQTALNGLAGVKSANVNLANGSALVEYDSSALSENQIKAAVDAAGYNLVLEEKTFSQSSSEQKKK